MSKNAANSVGGGIDNNMPPQNLTESIIAGGEDWLELAVFVDLTREWKRWVGDVFEKAVLQAKEDAEEQIIHIFEHRMAVQSFGSHFGPMYYDYRAFDQKELVWWFRKEPVDHENIASVRVRISGEACLCSDTCPENLVRWVYSFFDKLETPVRKIAISRGDLCIDIPGMNIETFRKAHMARHYATRAKSKAMDETFCGLPEGSAGTVDLDTWRYLESKGLTLYIGRSPLTMRAYNKLAELEHKMNPRKWQAMIERRWGGEIPTYATRVEFELRREALKARGIDTIEDFFRKRASLAEYLCTDWFRYLTMDPRGEKHTKDVPVHPGWEIVQQGFRSVFQGRLDMDLSPLPKAACDVSALGKQAFGVVLKAAECQGKELRNYSEFMRYCSGFFQDAAKSKKYEEWFETHSGHRSAHRKRSRD